MKLLILDMDGTVRVNSSADFKNLELTSGFIQHPEDQKLIPSAIAAIREFKSKGFSIIGASNQGGVAAGKKSLANCILEQQYTLSLAYQAEVEIDSILIAPDYEGWECYQCFYEDSDNIALSTLAGTYRKPKPGMINHAIALYGATEVLFVGDRPEEDEAAAKAANIPFIWAKDWWIN